MIIATNGYGEVLDRNGYAPSLFDLGYCIHCGAFDRLDRHEVFHGSGRREISKRYGCWVHLCHTCHMMLHNGKMTDFESKLKRECQHRAQIHYVWSTEEFVSLFGKNYV